MSIVRTKILARLLQAVAFILSATACSVSEEPEAPEAETTPQVIFLFSPGGLGDMSYNDCILEGVQNFKKAHPEVDIFLYSPPSMEVAERIFTDWLKRPGSDIPVVFTLASSDYEPLLDRYVDVYPLASNKRILMFESEKRYADEKIRTFQISMYGASFLAGVSAATLVPGTRSLVLLGSRGDRPIEAARDGFIEGFGPDYDLEYLADDWTGFVMPTETYRRMTDWSRQYGFIFPVAGGSNAGIYRYTREYDLSPLLAGMDIDQSGLSTMITGSVVKQFNRLVDEYFTQWLLTGTMPEPQVYGLESGYVDWVISPRYEALLREAVEQARDSAITKERIYHE